MAKKKKGLTTSREAAPHTYSIHTYVGIYYVRSIYIPAWGPSRRSRQFARAEYRGELRGGECLHEKNLSTNVPVPT